MTTILSRGQVIQPTQSVQLISKYYANGVLSDLDSFPQIAIIEPSGNVSFGPTSIGVYRLAVGTYAYQLEIPFTTSLGVWTDRWTGVLNGVNQVNEYNFVVETSQLPALNTDGYVALGDDPGFNYSQIAIQNINMLMKAVRVRLSSSGLAKTTNSFGETVYSNCDIFSVDQLTTFIAMALSAFNQIPTFTAFTFESTEIITIFFEVIMQHAVITALSAQALKEAGREFTITDNGVSWTPPSLSSKLAEQFNAELGNWAEKAKLIKQNMKSTGLGISLGSAMGSPRLRILRTVRARQIY